LKKWRVARGRYLDACSEVPKEQSGSLALLGMTNFWFGAKTRATGHGNQVSHHGQAKRFLAMRTPLGIPVACQMPA
jgi:hypothetical protein